MKSRPVLLFVVSPLLLASFGAMGCTSPDPGADASGYWDAAAHETDAGPFDCFGVMNCLSACSSQQCVASCMADSTATASGLNAALQSCLGSACPATDGGPCESSMSGACQSCMQNAQSAGQSCAAALVACIDDMSGSAGNQLGSGCNGLTNCLDGCQSVNCESNCLIATSSLGNQLFSILSECLLLTCPDVDGGPCQDVTAQSCSDCETASLANGGACLTDYSNCSNSP